ncbi:hypothetical protein [Xylanibacter oryzae]|uniref:hypothetical protein n=1 Tax=Xylanibacter oryzae TaxID=185293 RepID=UPI0004BA8AA3|nr:hypothetical protein [Xylanibacter oryzae]
MEKFNLNRFGILVKWSFFAYKRSFIKMTSILFFVLLAIFELNSLGNSGTQSLVVTSVFIFTTLMIVGASLNFANMKEKEDRITFIMLPTSNLEKFVSRYLYVTLGSLAAFLVALLGADIFRMLFALITGKGIGGSVFLDFFRTMVDSSIFANHVYVNGQDVYQANSWQIAACICLSLFCIWMHSIYMLGGTFFRRNAWLFTTMALIFASIIFGWIVSSFDFNMHLDVTSSSAVANTFSIVFLILIVINYFASYKLFTRMQVINNKWINV